MKPGLKKTIFIIIILLFSSCGDSGTEEEVISISASNLQVWDVGNSGNASDIRIKFTKPRDLDLVEEFRFMMVPLEVNFDLDAANKLIENFLTLSVNSSNEFSLDSGFKDIQGNLIEEEKQYVCYILSVTESDSSENELSTPSSSFSISRASFVINLANVSGGSGGMEVRDDGFILMGDFGSALSTAGGNKVFSISPNGDVTTFLTGMSGASGNDIDSEGNFYQCSTAGFITKVTPSGAESRFIENVGGGLIGLVLDSDGTAYVCNCGNSNILKITASGSISIFSSGSLFSCPNGIDMDPNGNFYVANFNNGNVIKISPAGSPSLMASIPGQNNGHLIYRDNFLYVVGRSGHQIWKVSLSGNRSLLAGSGRQGNDPGGLMDASFSFPNDLAFSPDGKILYVNDVNLSAGNNGQNLSPVIIRAIHLVEE